MTAATAENKAPALVDRQTPAKRRRGPNKAKPGTIEVRTEAVMAQAEIVKLLTAHATVMLGAAGAADMVLQVNAGDGWRSLSEMMLPHGCTVRFATAARSTP